MYRTQPINYSPHNIEMSDIPLLSNYDLMELADKYKLNVNNVLLQEEFIHIKPKDGGYIVLINDGTGATGHWTAFILRNKVCLYFDSFAVVPSMPIIRFLRKGNYKINCNNNDIQNYKSVTCGFYCLAFLHFMKHTKYPLHLAMSQFTSLFKNDTRDNDGILQAYIKHNF
jgi:hypothetical protein